VEATEPVSSLHYLIVIRGKILLSKIIPINNEKTFNFNFKSTFAMIPQVTLIVFYIRPEDSMVISDVTILNFEEDFNNFVSMITNMSFQLKYCSTEIIC
jgi:hypothetical protein